jgi:hypothetical protein
MLYNVPSVRPVTVTGLKGLAVAVIVEVSVLSVAEVAVTVYEVIALPPSEAGGEKETVSARLPVATETF